MSTSSSTALPVADRELVDAMNEDREITAALNEIKIKSKPLKDRKAQLSKFMLAWSKQHRAPVGIDIHVVDGKSITLAEGFKTETINEESLERILTEYFVDKAQMSNKEAVAAAKNMVTYVYDNRVMSVTQRLTIKDAVAAQAKKRAAASAPSAAKKAKPSK